MYSPGYKHWKAVTEDLLYIRYKCMAIDICNSCTVFQNHIQDAADDNDEKRQKTLQQHFTAHLNEASFGYQANAAMIRYAKNSWDTPTIKTYPKISPDTDLYQTIQNLVRDLGIKPGSTIHVTIDWDRDRNEFQRQHKKFYNKEKPQFISLNIKIEPETDKGKIS